MAMICSIWPLASFTATTFGQSWALRPVVVAVPLEEVRPGTFYRMLGNVVAAATWQ